MALAIGVGTIVGISATSSNLTGEETPDPTVGNARESPVSPGESNPPEVAVGESRGYLTTPEELVEIAQRARDGDEPYATGVDELLEVAKIEWDYELDRTASCPSSNRPAWIDDGGGASSLYARALAYHLTGDERYADEVRDILERVMSNVETIETDPQRCRLIFGWGTPELVASADLIEAFWHGQTCAGPSSTVYGEGDMTEGDCKDLFQNWLVKNPYYVVSYAGLDAQSNWGAAATTTMAYIADYLWDRPEVDLVHREPRSRDSDDLVTEALGPGEAYAFANQLALDRMNGYSVDLHSNESCDTLDGDQQHPDWEPVKSQITESGIIPEDARRDESCNVPEYDGSYQNYPQLHLGNLIQQCELMLRRGDRSCYDNVDRTNLADYTYEGPNGEQRTTHLRPGRGSLERAINAVIVDSGTEWRRPSALAVAYRYYRDHHAFDGIEDWVTFLRPGAAAAQDLSFGNLTHALAEDEHAPLPPSVAPPGSGQAVVVPAY